MVIQLLAGMFLGSVVTSLVWGIVLNSLKKRSEKNSGERDAVMHSLGELWIEIEGLVSSSRRGGGRSGKELRNRFTARLEEVKRLLRPNLHLFESYYVKYNEQLVAYYSRKVFGHDIDAVVATEAVSDREIETGLEFVEPPPAVPLPPETESVIEPPAGVTDKTVDETSQSPEEVTTSEDTKKSSDEEALAFEPKKPSVDVPVDETVDDERVVTSETVLFKPSFDSEGKNGAIEDELFDAPKPAAEEKREERGLTGVPEPEMPKEPEQSAAADDEEEVVFEPKQPKTEDISSTVSAASEGNDRMFNEEEFIMETMVDVDINSLTSFLKPQQRKAADASRQPEETTVTSTGSEGQEKEVGEPDLEVVIASNATHSGLPRTEEEPVSEELPQEPVFESAVQQPQDSGDETIPEETVSVRTEDLEDKTTESKPKADISVRDDFEMMFQEGPVAVEPSSTSAEQKQPADHGEELFEATLADAESEMITGNDVADKIALFEGGGGTEKEKKKKANGGVKDPQKAVSVDKMKAPSSASKSKVASDPAKSKKSQVAAKRGTRKDDSITGDDVADKIDAFFGLFDE